MRKYLLLLILASAASPSRAQDESQVVGEEIDRPRPARVERQQEREERRSERVQERRSEPADGNAGQWTPAVPRQVHQDSDQAAVASVEYRDDSSQGSHRENHRDAKRDHRELHAADPSRREHRDFHRDRDRDHRANHRSWDRDSQRASHGDYHRDLSEEHGELHSANPTGREHRDWHGDVSRQHNRRHSAWDKNWRDNGLYNWRSYRGRYSSLYNLSPYRDPFGYGYRRLSIGLTLGRGYYGSRYWLNDPWQYRLPPAYGPYRWVRYYDDALLVDIYSGQVVDVIHGFFW